jgi:hypothetical protein
MSTTLTIDDRQVEDWRIEQLGRAGWSEPQALMLALDPGVDLHLACDLLAKGCSPSLALRIVA